MPVGDIEVAADLMQESGLQVRASGGVSDDVIQECEAWLGVSLPFSYRAFLSRWGRLAFGGSEFYGFTRDGFAATRAPSFLWLTKTVRERGDIGQFDVVVKSSGFGPYFVLHCDKIDWSGECPVSLADNSQSSETWVDFGDFLLSEIRAEIEQAS